MPAGHTIRQMLTQGRSNEEVHRRYCVTNNVGSAVILVAFCALEVFLSWRLLGKEFSSYTFNGVFFDAILIAVSTQFLVIFRCLRERIVIGLAGVRGVLGLITMAVANVVNPYAPAIRLAIVALWGVALLVAVSMLIDSVRSPNPNEVTGPGRKMRGIVVLLAVIVSLFIVGALTYFVPSR